MTSIYTFKFTDSANKTDFIVAPYTSNGILSPSDSILIPQATGANTTLKLYGKGMQEYGEGITQNLIYMLENFANSTRPLNSIEGQIWCNNIGSGSPVTGAELFIRNSSTDDILGWDAIVLATGTSPMTGELILSGTPTNPLAAVPLSYIDGHANDDTLHLTPNQNTFLDGLILAGSPILTASDVNQLTGITGNVQTQLDDKISRTGDTMTPGANLTFQGTGEVLGLPPIPSVNDAAASKFYVDTQLGSGSGGDGVLTTVSWQGSDIKFDIFISGIPINTLFATGVSQVGHVHLATDITYDNTLNPSYPSNVQSAIDYIETNKTNLLDPVFSNNITVTNNITASSGAFSSTVSAGEPNVSSDLTTKNYVDSLLVSAGATTVTRTFEVLASPLNSGSPIVPYLVQPHTAGDNLLSITINGMKQYGSSNGSQQIKYDTNVDTISLFTSTGLDNTIIYDFNIAINGGGPVLVSIPSGTILTNHNDLINAVTNALITAGINNVTFTLPQDPGAFEIFTVSSTGTASTVVVSDPATINQYLFAIDASPTTITNVVFNNAPPTGSPIIPDELVVAGDVTSTFVVGKTYTVVGSIDSVNGSYDGIYSVHVSGATYDGSTSTSIPVASVDDPNTIVPLIFSSPSPTALGTIHLTPIGGFDSVLTPASGIDGDYIETDKDGIEITGNQQTSYVVFNVNIPTGSQIETLLA